MVGCSAYGCKNMSKQGFLMKVFPRDPQRRKQWVAKVRREDWEPTNKSYVCEVHFESEMWEKTREDGSRKLKLNAVPTIFSFTKPTQKRKPPVKREIKVSHRKQPSHDEPGPSSMEDYPSSSPESATFLETTSTSHVHKEQEPCNYELAYKKVIGRSMKYKKELRKLKRQINSMTRENNDYIKSVENRQILRKIFNQDQIEALQGSSMRFRKWSNVTVTIALRLRFACGSTGYEELLKQNIPLPSLRTLRRKLENIHFQPGILDEVFDFLKIKIDAFKGAHEKDCVITVDEMAITPATVYDPALKHYLGNVSLRGHSSKTTATHALVIMLSGITRRWKQTVAYYFTGTYVDSTAFKGILFEVVRKSEDLGLNVVSITSDMGALNQAFWRIYNITASRSGLIKNYVKHPADNQRWLYIIADVPHLFKNIKNMLVTNRIINITADIQAKFKLPSPVVDMQHIEDIIKLQEPLQFKLAPKLTEEDLTPSHFQKMKVRKSTNVASHDVSSALKFLSQELKRPEYETTAWFLDMVEQWFCLMSSRHPTLALSKTNMETYESVISHLKSFMNLFLKMKVGQQGVWKPSQTGVLLITQSILDIQEDFFTNKGYLFRLQFVQSKLFPMHSNLKIT